jgi:glycerophosphoryl diester phosphodiesterase
LMDLRNERFLVLGHRGSPRRHPENSLASLRAAIEEGADGFETDLRCLGDGSSVLFHDHELDGLPIEQFESAALKERVCTLAAVSELEEFAGKTRLMLEVKRVGWEEHLVSLVERWPDTVITSFDHRVIRRLADRGYPGELGVVFYGSMFDPGPYARSAGAGWVCPYYRTVDEEMVQSAKRAGVKVVPWTPNHPEEWDRLAELGCDGIITDLPLEAVQWRAGRADLLC